MLGLTVGNGSVISHDLQVGACFPFDVDVIPLQKKKRKKNVETYTLTIQIKCRILSAVNF